MKCMLWLHLPKLDAEQALSCFFQLFTGPMAGPASQPSVGYS
jgi:hypothetical protein